MDVNATLAEIRQLVLFGSAAGLTNESSDRLVELVASLDAWISGGGFLPTVWEGNRDECEQENMPARDIAYAKSSANLQALLNDDMEREFRYGPCMGEIIDHDPLI